MAFYYTGTLLASTIVVGSSGGTYGTHHSTLGVGGYLELETTVLRDLIPVDSVKGLEYDGLSSGRRRYNMLVSVVDNGITYQLAIPYSAWTGYTDTQKVTALADDSNWTIYGQNILVAGGGIDATQLSNDIIALDLSAYTAPSNIAITLDTGSTTFMLTDNSDTPMGIQYAADYSATFINRSLVDKNYVDTVAQGLDPKESVIISSTGNTDLTGGSFVSGTTMDGIVVDDGWRVLIKNQTDPIENGIYVYSASTSGFTRSDDFDGTPQGEVSTGAFVSIVSGVTHNGEMWMVFSPDPIVVNTDPIEWSLLSKPTNYTGGVGIIVSGTTIKFDGANVAGDSLIWSGTQLIVNTSGDTLGAVLSAKTEVSLFTSYTATTDTTLTNLRTDIDTVSGQTDTNTTDISNLQTNTITGATNIGGGIGIFSGTSNNLLNLRSISGTSNITATLSGDTILLSGTSVTSERIDKDIFQNNHSFLLGDVLAYTGTSYYRPLSTITGGEPVGVVSSVIDSNNFTITYQGYIAGVSGVTATTSTLLSGETVYYLSPTVAGKLTPDQSTTKDEIVKPMIITLTNDDANVVNYRGDIVLEPNLDDLMSNVGGAEGRVFSGSSGNTHFFRTLSASTGIGIVTNGNRIDISNTGITTITNVGSGAGEIYDTTGSTGNQKALRTINAGDAIGITTVGSIITIDVLTGSTKIMHVVNESGTTTNLTTINEFVGILSGNTSRVVNLPAAPIIGKPITISDVSGDGNSQNITINGNGKDIDGSGTGSINTDYGSFTVIFNGIIWKVISVA